MNFSAGNAKKTNRSSSVVLSQQPNISTYAWFTCCWVHACLCVNVRTFMTFRSFIVNLRASSLRLLPQTGRLEFWMDILTQSEAKITPLMKCVWFQLRFCFMLMRSYSDANLQHPAPSAGAIWGKWWAFEAANVSSWCDFSPLTNSNND